MQLDDLRREYLQGGLSRSDLASNPIDQFQKWLKQAIDSGIKDPTAIWWEEDIPEENDFITITTSIRTLKAPYLQEIFSINPECEGDFKENWFYKAFFAKHYEKGELSFRDKVTVEVDSKSVEVPYTVHHSTHEDNPHLPDQ